jgi:hypothetical protein
MGIASFTGASSVVKPGVVTTATRPSSPFVGQLIYDTTVATTLAWSGSAWIGASGKILQVVQATSAATTTISLSTYASIGPLTATITPIATTSKILVSATVGAILKENNTWANIKLFRGATDILTAGSYIGYTGTATANGSSASLTYLDSPATVSATTYEVKMASASNISYIQINAAATNTITLMEISA